MGKKSLEVPALIDAATALHETELALREAADAVQEAVNHHRVCMTDWLDAKVKFDLATTLPKSVISPIG